MNLPIRIGGFMLFCAFPAAAEPALLADAPAGSLPSRHGLLVLGAGLFGVTLAGPRTAVLTRRPSKRVAQKQIRAF